MAEYGNTFALWREGAAGAWQDYTHHEFVQRLGDGSLPRAAFLHYLVQDYVFLIHFARAWSLAVVKSETMDEIKTCAATVDALVNHEMALHVKICAAEGISEAQLFNATEAFENLAYTRYVIDAGLQGDFLDMMAALAPCVMGYGEIGQRLEVEKTSETYADWINTYADAEYQGLCKTVGEMMNNAVARRLGDHPTAERLNSLQNRFTTATKLEANFWKMGLNRA